MLSVKLSVKGSVFKCLLCQYKHIILTFTFPQQGKKKKKKDQLLLYQEKEGSSQEKKKEKEGKCYHIRKNFNLDIRCQVQPCRLSYLIKFKYIIILINKIQKLLLCLIIIKLNSLKCLNLIEKLKILHLHISFIQNNNNSNNIILEQNIYFYIFIQGCYYLLICYCLDCNEIDVCVSSLRFLFFFSPQQLTLSTVNSTCMHCLQSHKLCFSAIFFIKNGSHSTIYIFKNYFVTVFLVSVKINSIQTHPLSIYLIKEDSPFVVGFEVFGLLSEGLLVRTNVSYMVICQIFLFFYFIYIINFEYFIRGKKSGMRLVEHKIEHLIILKKEDSQLIRQ